MRYKNLGQVDEKSREFLRNSSLSGSSFFIRTMHQLALNQFIDNKYKLPKEEINPGTTLQLDKPFAEMNPLERGVYLEPKVIKKFAEITKLPAKQCEESFTMLSGLLTANIDGYIGKDIASAKKLLEVKTSGVKFKDIHVIAEEYKWQMQYYLFFFQMESIYLIYYNINHKSLSYMEIFPCPILQAQIKGRIKKCVEQWNQRVNGG